MQYFEDIELDQPLKGGTYELTESEIVEFAKKWDPFPIHRPFPSRPASG